MADRNSCIPASYVFLEKDGKFLLMRRCNTGYEDGNYQNPSGHVEKDETPLEAAVREVKEEVGVEVLPQDLEFVHASYRKNKEGTNNRIDFFYRTDKWSGDVQNLEPQKCDDLLWASYDNLPENIVPHVRNVITHIKEGRHFSDLTF